MDQRVIIGLERPIAFHPPLSRALGSIEAAIYLQQLYYWRDKGSREDEFIYKTKDEIEEETTLTRRQQDPIRKKLERLGVLETKLLKANGTPTLHYRLNIGRLNELLGVATTKIRNVQNVPTQSCNRDDSKHTKSANLLTETTMETTAAKQI